LRLNEAEENGRLTEADPENGVMKKQKSVKE